ncbi:MAG: alpha-galactosidase, partial [Leptospiraceae bacterium]|nr:alpha-galactosidase [Leptospiraceae bacterium]
STVYSGKDKDISPSLQFMKTSEENFYTNHSGKKGDFQSEGFTILWDESQKSGVIIGVSEPGDQNVKFHVKLSESGQIETLEAIFDIFSTQEFKGNSQVALVPIKIIPINEKGVAEALKDYGKSLGKKYGVKNISGSSPTGWCSWYYYYTKITEKTILDNINSIKSKNLPIEFIQIDDGYQKEIGEWLVPNEKFPAGMGFLAEEIKKAGYQPGIWLAPFLVRPNAEIFKMYPEAILKDEQGKPVSAIWQPIWGTGHTFCLDVTHPIAIEYLEKVFKTMTEEWGYNYLKLDFLYAGALDGVHYNTRLTPAQRYRNALEIIRKVVGKNTFLLGCGAPLIPSIGIFDGMRISCDITPFWGRQTIRKILKDKHALCTERALVNSLNRSFMHKNLWLNDPDCLITRKKKNKMSYDQTILMASVMALTGGMLLISDNMETVDEDRLPIFHKALEITKLCQEEESIPLGMMKYKFPRGIFNPGGKILGLWNPSKKSEEINLDFPYDFDIEDKKDFWTGETPNLEIDKSNKTIKALLKPFQSIILMGNNSNSE